MGQPGERPTPELRAFSDRSLSSRLAQGILTLVLTLVVTTVTCLASGTLKTIAGEIAPIWLTNAVLLGQLMAAPPRRWCWVLAGGLLGNLAANLLVGESLRVSFSYSAADILEVLVAFVFAPGVSMVAELLRPKALVKFLTGVLIAPIVSGLLAVTLLHDRLSAPLLPDLFNWFVSDALSLAIFTPAAIVFWTGEVTHLCRAGHRGKIGFLLLLVGVVTTVVFGQSHFQLLYWALLPLVLLALTADLASVLVGLLLCLVIAVSFTMRGSGPFWIYPYSSMQGRIFALQLFLVAALAIALPVSAIQTQRNRLITLLREGERRYRILAENATDIVMSMALDGRLTYVSPRATVVMRVAPEDLIRTALSRPGFSRRPRRAGRKN